MGKWYVWGKPHLRDSPAVDLGDADPAVDLGDADPAVDLGDADGDNMCWSCHTLGEVRGMACICPRCGAVIWGC